MTPHPHLAPRLKKAQSYISKPLVPSWHVTGKNLPLYKEISLPMEHGQYSAQENSDSYNPRASYLESLFPHLAHGCV